MPSKFLLWIFPLLLSINILASNHDQELAQLQYDSAKTAYENGDITTALKLVDKALFTCAKEVSDTTLLANCHLMKGAFLYLQLKPREALGHLDTALHIKMNLHGKVHIALADIYNNIGLCYNGTGEYIKSVAYLDLSRQIIEKEHGPLNQDLAKFHFNQSLNYRQLGEYDKAIQSILTAKEIRLHYVDSVHFYIADYHSYIGDNYVDKKEWTNAIANYERAEGIYQQTLAPDHRVYGMHKLHFATAYHGARQFDKARHLFLQARDIRIKNYGESDPQLSVIYRKLAQIEMEEDNSVLANRYQLKSLEVLGYLDDRESFSKVSRYRYLLATLASRADYYENTATNLDSAFFYWQENLRFIDFLRTSYRDHETQILLSDRVLPVYEGALGFAYRRYQEAQDPFWLNFIFVTVQSYRRNALNLALFTNDALQLAALPEEEIHREKYLKDRLLQVENDLLSLHPDSNMIAHTEMKQQLLHLQDSFENFVGHLEELYPKYHAMKYSVTRRELSDLQKDLAEGELLMHYFCGFEKLYSLACTKDECMISEFSDLSKLQKLVEVLRTDLSKGTDLNVPSLKSTSRHLGEILLGQELKKWPQVTHLTILPDGFLRHIPFGCLETNDLANWLIYDLDIHYRETFNRDILRPNDGQQLMAFAPSYLDYEIDTALNEDVHLAALVRSGNLPLPGARREAAAISEIFAGTLFAGNNASESTFKANAGQADILHLSMHATMNHEEPLKSKLLFTKSDENDDGNLHAYELYSLQLNAQLAVLSACNTGYGKLRRGEGTMSLSRAFSHAGVPSVLMSLWKVPDQASEQIITNFYRFLRKGWSKAAALRMAKLDYIENSIDENSLHPYFWSGFVLTGDPSPIASRGTPIWWKIGLILFPLVFIILWRRRSMTSFSRDNLPRFTL